jgi:hypothetical protein
VCIVLSGSGSVLHVAISAAVPSGSYLHGLATDTRREEPSRGSGQIHAAQL